MQSTGRSLPVLNPELYRHRKHANDLALPRQDLGGESLPSGRRFGYFTDEGMGDLTMPVERWSDDVVVLHLADDPQFTDDLDALDQAISILPTSPSC
jgi:hypothetical protein